MCRYPRRLGGNLRLASPHSPPLLAVCVGGVCVCVDFSFFVSGANQCILCMGFELVRCHSSCTAASHLQTLWVYFYLVRYIGPCITLIGVHLHSACCGWELSLCSCPWVCPSRRRCDGTSDHAWSQPLSGSWGGGSTLSLRFASTYVCGLAGPVPFAIPILAALAPWASLRRCSSYWENFVLGMLSFVFADRTFAQIDT